MIGQMNTRRESRINADRFRSGKLVPISMFPVRGGEAGMLQQTVNLKLDPVAGRLLSTVHADLFCVAVPVQAMLQLLDPDNPEAGVTELIRLRALSGEIIDQLELEHEISKRCDIKPRSYAGVKKVTSFVRLAHNAAVNYLRQSLYDKAVTVPHSNTAVTPALLSTTILTRLNAVLDPDDHINGAVNLDIPNVNIPVRGVSQLDNSTSSAADARISANAERLAIAPAGGGSTVVFIRKAGNPAGTELDIYAELQGASAGNVSLTDFYNAQKIDTLTRQFREIVNRDKVNGEEMVLRQVFGLSVDQAKNPWTIYKTTRSFGTLIKPAMDGAGMLSETQLSDLSASFDMVVPLPAHELGYIVVTFASVRPDEVMHEQPHPYLSENWSYPNRAAEQLKLDPEPVLGRDVYADIASASENTVMFYVGHNELKRAYSAVGYTRNLDSTTVEAKTNIWQYAIPASVTPESVIYPENLDQYPFLDANAEICTYDISAMMTVQTPEFFGPSPVETVDIIDEEDIFEENV